MKSGMTKNGLLIMGVMVGFLYAAQDAEIKEREADYLDLRWTTPNLKMTDEMTFTWLDNVKIGSFENLESLKISKDDSRVSIFTFGDYVSRGVITVLDAQTGSVLEKIKVRLEDGDLRDGEIAFNSRLFINSTGSFRIKTGAVAKKFDACSGSYLHARVTALSDDESLFAAAQKDICLWNTKTGKVVRKLSRDKDDDSVTQLVISVDNEYAVSGHQDGSICIWNIKTGRLETSHQLDRLSALTLSRDNRYVVIGYSGKIAIWDTRREGEDELMHLEGTFNKVGPVVMSEDKSFVAAITKLVVKDVSEVRIRIWDVRNGKVCNTLNPYASSDVNALAISHDASFIVSIGSLQGGVWRLLIDPLLKKQDQPKEGFFKRLWRRS